MVNSLSSQSPSTHVRNFIDVFSAIDLILGEEVLTNLNVEAVIRQGNRSLNDHSLRLNVDLTNTRHDGNSVIANRPPLDNCYILENQFRREVVMVGTYSQCETLLGEVKDGGQVWKKIPFMFISPDFALSKEFRQGNVPIETEEEHESVGEDEAGVGSHELQVDAKFHDYNSKTYEDIINLFECGIKPNDTEATLLPFRLLTGDVRASKWTNSHNSSDFSTFCQLYIYIQLHKNVGKNEVLKKTVMKNHVRQNIETIVIMSVKKEDGESFFDYAVKLYKNRSLKE